MASKIMANLVFLHVIASAPSNRNKMCSKDDLFGLGSLHNCQESEWTQTSSSTPHWTQTSSSTPHAGIWMSVGLTVLGLVTVALLAWALHSYLAQVCFLWLALSCRQRHPGYQQL